MRIEYDFIRVGSFVEPRRGHIYIDIGNQHLPGVIDTHGDESRESNFSCSSSLIASEPSLVTDWISPDDLAQPVRVVMHENPDYDCIASAFLVKRLLEARAKGERLPSDWSEWAPLIADSARRIDRGETRLRLPIRAAETPLTPYLSILALHQQIDRSGSAGKEGWSQMIVQGQKILDRALLLARRQGLSDLNAVDLRGSLADLGDLEAIVEEKAKAFTDDALRIGLDGEVPVAVNAIEGVFALRLPLRNQTAGAAPAMIACLRDPQSDPAFFKSVIRGAYGDRIHATCIFTTVPADPDAGTPEWVRPVISVDPDSPFDLRGLGAHLDALETAARLERGVPRVGRPRPGFNNSDPWYDGRGFAYTIVDAPRWGTLLSPETVRREVVAGETWLSLRVDELVRESLARVRHSTDAAERRNAFVSITHAMEVWSSAPLLAEPRLYRECVDAVITLATAEDLASVEALASRAPDVLLGLLSNADPAVRAAALYVAGNDSERVARYARDCGRTDVLPLLAIVTARDAETVVRVVGQHGNVGGAWLRDAIEARARRGMPAEEPVLAAAARLEAHAVGSVHAVAGRSGTIENIRRAVADGDRVAAGEMLIALLGDAAALTPARRQALLRVAGEVMATVAAAAADDEALVPRLDAVVVRLRSICSAQELFPYLAESTFRDAARVSSAFAGLLLRTAASAATARWGLAAAALEGQWETTLVSARTSVLTPEDARVYQSALSLTRSARSYRALGRPASARSVPRLAFLLLAACRGRGVPADSAVCQLLGDVASLRDLSTAAEPIGRLRERIADELRHAAPDHFLIADAEPSLAKSETFARLIALVGPQETSSGSAICLLFALAANLPEIDWTRVDELLRLGRNHRGERDAEVEVLAEQAFACSAALDSLRGDGLISNAERLRAGVGRIVHAISALPATPLGRAVGRALRDVEFVLESYADVLETMSRHDDDAVDALSVRMLQASTFIRFAEDYAALAEKKCADLAARTAVRLAYVANDTAVRRAHSRVRAALGQITDLERAYRAAEQTVRARPRDGDDAGTVDTTYGRIRDLLALPEKALDAAYGRLVDTLISRYDIHTARHRIDEYSGGLPLLLRFWMSGWTVVIPLVFVSLFLLDRDVIADVLHPTIEIATFVLVATAAVALALEGADKLLRVKQPRTVESLRYKLFLPHYVPPVLIGVFTAAISDEATSHLAMHLTDGRYAVLAAAFFVAAAWALGQLIRRHGGSASTRNIVVAAGRLFAYGFVIAILLNLLLAPMLRFEKGWFGVQERMILTIEDSTEKAEVHDLRLPMKIDTAALTLFPRHMLLDALFGMFIAIFLRGFWKMGESE